MKKNAVATLVALVCVLMVASCEYKPKVVEISGSDGFATFTQKVGDRELLGVQNASGNPLTEACFANVEFESGYFVCSYPDGEGYNLLDEQGKNVFPDLGRMRYCSFSTNVTDSLGHFVVGNENKRYWFFPMMSKKVVGPRGGMRLYPLEQVILYEQDGKMGLLSYDNKEVSPLGTQLVLASRQVTKVVKDGKKTVRQNVEVPVVYVGEKGSDDWQKFNRLTGEAMGAVDNTDIDLINKSNETMMDYVYAVRPKKQ